MTDMLANLVRGARELVRDGYYDRNCSSVARTPSLTTALRRHHSFPVIAEVKLSSPTMGRISTQGPSELIHLYREGGAAGISVVTEPERFGGDLATVCEATRSGLPVLMKDFIVDERQIDAADRFGASAVLLIEEVFEGFSTTQRRDSLVEHAHALGLEVLLEAASESCLDHAIRSGADLIGLNQRDLRSMTVDPNRGRRLLDRIVDRDRSLVVMSGIGSREQVESLRDAGATAVLVGGAAVASADPRSFLRSLEVER